MYKIYIGEISQQRREDWFRKDENPYNLWDGKPLAEVICIGSTWVTADEMLRDRVYVDWGSIAWRANKNELTRLVEVCKFDTVSLEQLNPSKDYAVVFLETVFGDSA